ncbi:hypothetical protein DL766_005209 [Monosporascus sp. MC13-8B]|uniref:BZIP domain-containing protein n=1 Tax=Monosporascus cannonballus TaxID=155416 RepID=A0ABY0GWI1_9PEZI|nr:hypothetical protein DL763_011263 [Monosporascus cannonballus]RYO77152.1 hypothetical protein DL762_009450 [Monosporascus cannonballus]RYP29783.1 hypothetical protein DL766_005209 [Monosporascus sp. MC13-8B]
MAPEGKATPTCSGYHQLGMPCNCSACYAARHAATTNAGSMANAARPAQLQGMREAWDTPSASDRDTGIATCARNIRQHRASDVPSGIPGLQPRARPFPPPPFTGGQARDSQGEQRQQVWRQQSNYQRQEGLSFDFQTLDNTTGTASRPNPLTLAGLGPTPSSTDFHLPAPLPAPALHQPTTPATGVPAPMLHPTTTAPDDDSSPAPRPTGRRRGRRDPADRLAGRRREDREGSQPMIITADMSEGEQQRCREYNDAWSERRMAERRERNRIAARASRARRAEVVQRLTAANEELTAQLQATRQELVRVQHQNQALRQTLSPFLKIVECGVQERTQRDRQDDDELFVGGGGAGSDDAGVGRAPVADMGDGERAEFGVNQRPWGPGGCRGGR